MDEKEINELIKNLSIDIKIDKARYGYSGYITIELKFDSEIIDTQMISGQDIKDVIGE